MMASKKTAVFAAKFQTNLPRNGKSLGNSEYKLYKPEFTNAKENLPKYNNNIPFTKIQQQYTILQTKRLAAPNLFSQENSRFRF